MIPLNSSHWQTTDWQDQLRNMIRDPAELLDRLQLNPEDQPDIAAALADFPLRVTEAFVAKMKPGDWHDPLLLQILPRAEEMAPSPGYSNDPLEEQQANPVPGIIHKYHGRVLLVTTPACAIHCRYCFRRSFPYGDNRQSSDSWAQALDYVAGRPEIHEVILSGGDPLTATDNYLGQLIEHIAAIPHVRTLRLHTRLPVVLPARITPSLTNILTQSRLRTVMVIHCNHHQELNDATDAAFAQLRKKGVTLLNQSVLLREVNDNSNDLTLLSHRLFESGVLPYYLHILDKVQGSRHFSVEVKEARQLVNTILKNLPGYLVPKLVREDPGAHSKTPLAL